MENITRDFLKKIDRIYQGNIPEYVIEKARYSFLDYLCVTIAGAKYNKSKIENFIQLNELEHGEYKIIGLKDKFSLKDAVFLNGLNAHALDYDDGTNAGIIHLGSPIFSALLPLAYKRHIDLKKFLKAVIIGYEVSFTIAYSIQPEHKRRGFHATGTCGILGATVALCYALNFSRDEIENAFSIAAVSSSGMLKVLDDGSELKPYNVAKTALMSIISIQMAKAGFIGHHDVLSGDRGFLAMMAGNGELNIVAPLLNGTYAIEKTYIKPYAACRYCHPAIDAAILVREEILSLSDDFEKITNIEIETYSLAIKGHDHRSPSTIASAKMSIPYSVAVALLIGRAGLNEYSEEYLNNKSILEIMDKMIVLEDSVMSKDFPKKQSARVKIKTSKKIYMKVVEYPKGEPENKFSEIEFKNRFLNMCDYADKNISESELLYYRVLNEEKDLEKITELI